ncbi:CPBP family intramembrane glutamic endopeptidase [Psychrobacillus sp. FSL W7-1493]|uniref:CPBP family intramembrane glutamic endopeptidase n=1 Tax=Psychrobacillus sp. FSL W7-1493 TaxID=2921552 RepID=UPI0030FA1EA1
MNRELLVSKQNNSPNKRGITRKTFLFFFVFLLTFYISNVEIPQLPFFKGIYPEFVVLNIENSLLTILFLSILLLTIGKKYTYLFKFEPLKKGITYIWVFGTILLIYIMMVLFTNVSGLTFYSSPLELPYFILLLIRVVIIVPIEEEFVYRGLLLLIPYNKIKYLMLIVSSVIFALIHDDPYKIIWLSLGLGILGIRFNNIWIPIIAHSIWNLLASFFAVKV